MPDDAPTTPSAPVDDASEPKKKTKKPYASSDAALTKRQRNRAATSARVEMMAMFVASERKREPTVRYGEMRRRVMQRFECSEHTAERALTMGGELVRKDFERFCADAPRAIFDAYMDIHAEAMREKNWTAARRALDSVRDMFGMRSAINVNLNLGNVVPPEAYAPISDEQLEALAMLDRYDIPNAIDIPSVEQSLELAGVALEAIEANEDSEE